MYLQPSSVLVRSEAPDEVSRSRRAISALVDKLALAFVSIHDI